MTKKPLRIGPEVARKPVRLTLTIGPDLADELKLYSDAYEREHGEAQTTAQLAPHMAPGVPRERWGGKAAKRASVE